jgi:1-deoxy-D-xylulose-5-phosphate synthase
MTERCLAAASLLEHEGIDATVYDVRVVSPTDPAMLADTLGHRAAITVEDGVRIGGAGTHLIDGLQALADERSEPMPTVRVLGTPRRFLAHGGPDLILSRLGLDAVGISASVARAVRGEPEPAPVIAHS